MMLGGVSDAEIDEHTNEVAGFAVQQLNSNSNFAKDGQLKLGKVVSAKRQVVAGINHMLTIETTDASGKVQTVEVTVWEKPAYNKPTNEPPMELTKFKVVGAGPIAEANEEWNTAAQHGLDQINQRSNSLYPYQLVDVTKATPSNDGNVDLLLVVKRGERIQESFKVTVKKHDDDRYQLLVSYILRCSCHEGQPSRIRDLLHHAVVVALYPIKHKNQTLIQPK
eukprot:jgi/Chrzof1/6605/Cz19g02120.t1